MISRSDQEIREWRVQRPWLLAGIALAIAGAVGVWVVPPFTRPPSEAGVGEFALYYEQHRSAALVFGPLAVLGSSVALAPFVAWREIVRRTQPTWSTLGLAAAIVTVATTCIGVAVLVVAAYRPDADPRLVSDIGWALINLAAGPVTALSIAAYLMAFRHSAYQRGWLTLAGVVIACAHLLVSASWADHGFLSLHGAVSNLVPALWFLWIGSVSLALLRPRDQQSARQQERVEDRAGRASWLH